MFSLPARFARLSRMTLIVVAPTTATARTSTTSGTSTASGAPTAARSTGTAAIGLRTSFVDIQRTATKLFPVQCRNGFLGFAGIWHFYECKSSGTASVTIRDHADLIDFAMRLKQGPQFRFRGAVREIANKKLLHGCPFSVSQRGTSDFVGGFGWVSRVGMLGARFGGKRVASQLNWASLVLSIAKAYTKCW
jgi:hypothetical protein